MKKQIIALAVCSLLATSSFAGPRHRAPRDESNRAPKEESIGLGSGAAIGGLAGGPIGLIIGAAFGGWLGDRMHTEKSGRRAAESRAADLNAQATTLATSLAATQGMVTAKDAALTTERIAHRQDLAEALSVEVFFRTEESGLGSATEERLARLAALVEPMEGAVIRLEGHTDARGTESFNTTLSSARADAVRAALIKGGLPAERVIITASGEADSVAAEKDVDGMALERRVQMNVVDGDDANRVALQGTP